MSIDLQRQFLGSVATVVIAVVAAWSVALDSLSAHVGISIVALLVRELVVQGANAREIRRRYVPWRAAGWGLVGLAVGLVVSFAAGLGKWQLLPATLLWGCVVGETIFSMLLRGSVLPTPGGTMRALSLGSIAGVFAAATISAPALFVAGADWGEIGATVLAFSVMLIPMCSLLALTSFRAAART